MLRSACWRCWRRQEGVVAEFSLFLFGLALVLTVWWGEF